MPCFLHDSILIANLHSNGEWKNELLEVLFCDRDKELMKKIPLCPFGGSDRRRTWHYTPNSIFSVSSAYKMASNRKSRSLQASSFEQQKFW